MCCAVPEGVGWETGYKLSMHAMSLGRSTGRD
jgi:hypothetical protein